MGQKSFQYRQFTVEEEHVTAYVQHREEQKAYALIRAREKQQQKKCNIKSRNLSSIIARKNYKKVVNYIPDKTGAAALNKALHTFLYLNERCLGAEDRKYKGTTIGRLYDR